MDVNQSRAMRLMLMRQHWTNDDWFKAGGTRAEALSIGEYLDWELDENSHIVAFSLNEKGYTFLREKHMPQYNDLVKDIQREQQINTLDQQLLFQFTAQITKMLTPLCEATPQSGYHNTIQVLKEVLAMIQDYTHPELPKRQIEFLQALKNRTTPPKNAATRFALRRRNFISSDDAWDEITLTARGRIWITMYENPTL